MSRTPFEHTGSLQIGTVDFVSSDEVKVALDIETPESMALNTGGPRPFPRVNSYVLIPVDDGFLVGQITWLAVERSAFPQRRGMKDFGLVDLPYPLRKLSLNPLGTLRKHPHDPDQYIFRRGADALPSVGTAVMLPTERQLRSIVESGENRRVLIGTSPLAGNAEVRVDPNRLFGRHLAVLGNTGSGKSCSIAGLIRWNLEQAKEACSGQPNARFIILDPNGEYSRAFSAKNSEIKARIFKVKPGENEDPLQVPLWFWNSAEWASITQASAKTQRPTLIHALRFVREGDVEPVEDAGHEMRRFLRTIISTIQIEKNSGSPWGSFPRPKNFYEKLEKWKKGLEPNLDTFPGEPNQKLHQLIEIIEGLCEPRRGRYPHYDFTLIEVNELIQVARDAHVAFGGLESDVLPSDVDAPCPFEGDSLLRSVEAVAEMLNVSEHVETLLIRIRTLLTDTRMKPILSSASDITLEKWLSDYIGKDQAEDGCVSVIDLSLVPTEVVHILTAVIARMIFEALQRYMKINSVALPTVLVMEEAHTFIKRYQQDIDGQDTAKVCCQIFERIAREGRKFGLGLVLSSQRPSELSPTVLSQCNTYLLHRITNDRDQELVHRLVPDNLKGLLRELPLLPSQNAILLGWASELPVLVKMNNLPESYQPRSNDPDFWGSWVGMDEEGHEILYEIDWSLIANDWQGKQTVENVDETVGDDA
ncbi:ATPase [Methanomicrobiaceae archaeon CYW5]|uniref:ATP-binding protein n=1 Tax=Methanovulcanius yangii TaxID=1789227 RepID=UPI0029C9B85F|nr:ATP-binding protein [Methanovulcanius yangii]MBT8508716.1 ATPase [Methanovulcanius yangii]